MEEDNVTARIGIEFNNELEEIKQKRIEIGIDQKKKSTKVLTNLIITHEDWQRIKEDTIELPLWKNGKKKR